MHLVFLIQTTQSVNQLINQLTGLITTQLWMNKIEQPNRQKRRKDMFEKRAAFSSSAASRSRRARGQDTRFVGAGVQKAELN